MKEFKFNVRVVQINAMCEVCGDLLKPTGVCLMSDPPWYEHKCRGCGEQETLRNSYPYLGYERIPDGLTD